MTHKQWSKGCTWSEFFFLFLPLLKIVSVTDFQNLLYLCGGHLRCHWYPGVFFLKSLIFQIIGTLQSFISQLWNHLPLCPVALCFTCNKLCNMDWLYLNSQSHLHYQLCYQFLTDVTKAVSSVLSCGGRTGPSGSVYGGGKGERGPLGMWSFLCVRLMMFLAAGLGLLGLTSRKWGWISRKQKLEAQNKASEDDVVTQRRMLEEFKAQQ